MKIATVVLSMLIAGCAISPTYQPIGYVPAACRAPYMPNGAGGCWLPPMPQVYGPMWPAPGFYFYYRKR